MLPIVSPEPRCIYPAGDDPAALRAEMRPAGISAPLDVPIIAVDEAKYGDELERPVKIVLSQTQAARLVELLAAGIGNSSRPVGA